MQNHPSVKAQLQQAYQYIKAGQRATALQILAPICKNDLTNATAWWLAAHAFNDDEHIQYALRQVLSINPNFPGAAEKLSRLQLRPALSPRPSPPIQRQTPTPATPPKQSSRSSFGWVLGLTIMLIGVTIAGAAIFVTQGKNDDEPTSSDAVVEVQNTTTVNTRTPLPTTSIPLPPTLPPENTATAIPPSLTPTIPPPTRTPRPTDTPIATFAAPATTDPTNFGDTYWEGSGDGPNMETYVNSRGRYLRFYRFPILVYVIGDETQSRRNAVNGALKEINQVVQIRTTDDVLEANIVLEFVPFDTLQVRCEAESYLVVGCGTIDYFGGGLSQPIIKGSALISSDDNFSLQSTILHELLHAMGIFSHSPNPNDVMYYEETGISRLSQRDINTLRRLYEGSPSFAYDE